MINITFSTCWYNFKAKFPNQVYLEWIDNMLTNVNNYYLVIYTDKEGKEMLKKYETEKIKIFIKEAEEFYNYKYKNYWISNHGQNPLLNNKVDWKVNMLWSEKIHFVNETITNRYFDTEFYGWCDIGYFRNRINDLKKEQLVNWPSPNKIAKLDKDKIYYALVNNDVNFVNSLFMYIQNKNVNGLPKQQIPPQQISIAGGFFILHKSKINWWKETYDERLQKYFVNNYLVKDDQLIIVDCIFSNLNNFSLHKEDNDAYDNWFLFQRLLL